MKRRNIFIRLGLGLVLATAPLTALALSAPGLVTAASADPPAAFTTTDIGWSGGAPANGDCLAPPSTTDPVNCNIYPNKDSVWLNGGPDQTYSGNGIYFFAVLDPGGQHNPNDGSAGLLSTDSYTSREYSVSGTTVSFLGSGHNVDGSKIQLLPFNDTTNPGGVYIAATCYLGATIATLSYPVTPASCKYDMFKVSSSAPTPGNEFNTPVVSKTAFGAFTNTYAWNIQKTANTYTIDTKNSATFTYTVTVSHDSGTPSDPSVSGMIDVTDPNYNPDFSVAPFQLSGITDTLSDNTICNVDTTGDQPATSTLDLTQADNFFPYTCTDLIGGYPSTGSLTNTVFASWLGQDLINGASTDAGSSLPYTTLPITFTPTVVGNCVTVTDPMAIPETLGTPCVGDNPPTDIFTYTYAHTFSGDPAGTCTTHDNTATVTTNDTDISVPSNTVTVTVCVGADLTVSKTANPTFTRTYLWNITKTASVTSITGLAGSTATINYTVKAGETGFTDSAWQVNGTITVTNPNDWESITPSSIGDLINNGGTCAVGALSPSTLGEKGSGTDVGTASYTCTYTTAPSPSAFTNTATASWDSGAAYTPDGSASGIATGVFGSPTSPVNQTVHVTDPLAPTTALGTLTATNTLPYASGTYPVTLKVTLPSTAFSCSNFTNTAWISETGQSASATVKLCGTVVGALTMGFWQNNNGQAIIGAGVSGSCSLEVSWLRQFAPFQDLGASSTCKQVASYVYGVIKLANAGGATMNAMLKSQMLATALDVYFSDPGLGGNKIGAPVPLGGVMINLTNINNSGLNVSAAFGGSTTLTIMQMLTYSASQSGFGGTPWYGTSKATQGLAEVAFDDINNL